MHKHYFLSFYVALSFVFLLFISSCKLIQLLVVRITFPFFFAYIMQDKRKDAVKKVIAAMTVGKDVSSLFTDVVNCMQTENLELKKLVYLYLINYAKSQPDLAILAVNTFVKVNHAIYLIFKVLMMLYKKESQTPTQIIYILIQVLTTF